MELILIGKFNSVINSKNFEEMLNEKSIPFIRKAEDMGMAVHPSFTGGIRIYISKEDWNRFVMLCTEINASPEDFLGSDSSGKISSEDEERNHKTSTILTWLAICSFFGIFIINMIDLPNPLSMILSILCGLGMIAFEFAAHVICNKTAKVE